MQTYGNKLNSLHSLAPNYLINNLIANLIFQQPTRLLVDKN